MSISRAATRAAAHRSIAAAEALSVESLELRNTAAMCPDAAPASSRLAEALHSLLRSAGHAVPALLRRLLAPEARVVPLDAPAGLPARSASMPLPGNRALRPPRRARALGTVLVGGSQQRLVRAEVDVHGAKVRSGFSNADSSPARPATQSRASGTLANSSATPTCTTATYHSCRVNLADGWRLCTTCCRCCNAPQREVELPERQFAARLPLPGERELWHQAAQAAIDFCRRASNDRRISESFRQICRRNETNSPRLFFASRRDDLMACWAMGHQREPPPVRSRRPLVRTGSGSCSSRLAREVVGRPSSTTPPSTLTVGDREQTDKDGTPFRGLWR